jgi:signal transduction histidine kinase
MTVWQADPTMTTESWVDRLPRAVTEPFRRRTWAHVLYALVGLPIGVAGFTFTVTTISVSAGLIVTFVGLPLMALTGLIERGFGDGLRRFANRLIDADVPPAQRFRANPGLLGWIGSCLKDGTAWRARLYLLLKLPVGIAQFVATTVFLSYGLGGLTYAIWRPFLPCQTGHDGGTCHRGASITDRYFLDTPLRIGLVFVTGLLLVMTFPWVIRAFNAVDRGLVRSLLGPTGDANRVEELERTRAAAVDDSAATLRRIERDLHDGAQARLVALAMNVGLAKEKLAEGGDPAEASRLLDTAHTTAKQAIVELRDLARGIHPPVLDAGLDAALATLAAHSSIPVSVHSGITDRPDPAIETMAYFCAAELITNAVKHSGGTRIGLDVRSASGRLRLQVTDDGNGGARMGAGSGLRGLAERIATVDGTVRIDSPDGGPTAITVELPLRAGRTA